VPHESGQTELEAAEHNDGGQGPQQVIYKEQCHAFLWELTQVTHESGQTGL
jgi:hypothetical protein